MFKTILVPIDGSATSQLAVTKAAGLATAFGSNVTVVYVIDPYPFTGVGTDFSYGQTQYLSAATAEANAALTSARDAFASAGITATSLVVESHAVHHGIMETAKNINADLIVMGSHGRRGITKLVLGSVAQRVLGAAQMPVMVVRD